MLNKNKFWKSLLGQFAEIIVAKNVAYTDDATFDLFVANAVDGEIGVVYADTKAVVAAAGPAIAATDRVFIALKRDGQVETTNVFTKNMLTASRIAYAAPVAQASTLTLTGAPVAGKEYGVRVIETTAGYQPFPNWYYSVVAKTGETLAQLGARIVALVNDTTNIINKNTDPIVTAAYNAGVITFTATSAGPSFRLGASAQVLSDLAGVFAYTGAGTAAPFWGSGSGAQVVELEKVAAVNKGITHNYPNQGTHVSDFGYPTAMASAALNYNVYTFIGTKSEMSPTPADQHQYKAHVIVAIPTAGGPEVAVKLIFGL